MSERKSVVNIKDLANEIMKELQVYANATEEKVDVIAEKVSIDTAAQLKKTSQHRTGKYAESWTNKELKGTYVVYNKKHYQLTHLLEKSHLKRNGGRTVPKEHIHPAEEKAIDQFVKRLKGEL